MVSCNKDKEIEEMVNENNNNTEQTVTSDAVQNFSGMVSSTNTDSTLCYEITFPLSFELEDGSTVTANTEDDLEDLFEDGGLNIVDFVYPVNLVNPETGETEVANNEEELIALFILCFDGEEWEPEDGEIYCDSLDFEFGQLGCYDLGFPLNFVLEDGSTVTANTEDDLADIFTGENPPVDFAYPITLINQEDGTTHLVNNPDEVEELLEECEEEWENDWEDEFGDGGVYIMTIITIQTEIADSTGEFEQCYDFVYPISVLTVDGEILTANNDEEMIANVFTSNTIIEDFVYPFQVTNNDTGEVITAENDDDVEELIENCLP